MKYNIKVQSKEYYKDVLGRLEHLGYDLPLSVKSAMGSGYIGINTEGNVWWCSHNYSDNKLITLDDLYTDKFKPPQSKGVMIKENEYEFDISVGNAWAATALKTNRYKVNNKLIFLSNCFGKWEDEQGNEINGYLTFKPK